MFSGKKPKNSETKQKKKRKRKQAWDYSLYLLGIFVANEYDDWVDVNAVKTFNGVRSNVK